MILYLLKLMNDRIRSIAAPVVPNRLEITAPIRSNDTFLNGVDLPFNPRNIPPETTNKLKSRHIKLRYS